MNTTAAKDQISVVRGVLLLSELVFGTLFFFRNSAATRQHSSTASVGIGGGGALHI